MNVEEKTWVISDSLEVEINIWDGVPYIGIGQYYDGGCILNKEELDKTRAALSEAATLLGWE